MAGSLIKIDEEIVTSAVASVTLGGANWDSSYDVYMVKINNLKCDVIASPYARFTVSGTPDTSANYDWADKVLRTDTTFGDVSNTNQTNFTEIFLSTVDTVTGSAGNAIHYLYNMNNSSEYSFISFEETTRRHSGVLFGHQGGGVHTVAQACDGIQYVANGQNFSSGTFTLYGLKK